jgi:hypothetical protein
LACGLTPEGQAVGEINYCLDPYVHPDTHPADIITETENRVFLTAAEKNDLLASLDRETFVFEQIAASDTWIIKHPLNKKPSITVVDSADTVVVGEVVFISLDTVILNFSAPFSGRAYLN